MKNNKNKENDSLLFLESLEAEIDIEKESYNEKEIKAFFGRKEELSSLEVWLKATKTTGIGVAVYGLRRCGKTRLVKEFIERKTKEFLENREEVLNFSFYGSFFKTKKENIEEMIGEIQAVVKKAGLNNIFTYKDFVKDREESGAKKWSWWMCFKYFEHVIEQIPKRFKLFIFFDEAAWFSKSKDFMIEFSKWWNVQGFCRIGLMLFMASSNKSWMDNKIIQDRKGMFQRLQHLEVKPFSFKEMVVVFRENRWIAKKEDILIYYFIFGGFIKHYVENDVIDFNFSLKDIKNKNVINSNKFIKYLLKEYEAVFEGVFSEKLKYKEIIKALYDKKQSTIEDLLEGFKEEDIEIENLKKQVKRLEEEGFVGFFYDEDGKKHYYIAINLLNFYFHWQEFNTKNTPFKLEGGEFFNWRGWMFELFVFEILEAIIEKLGIDNKSKAYLNYVIKNKDLFINTKPKTPISQIDVLIKTIANKNKKSIRNYNVIECKFHDNIDNVKQKNEIIDVKKKVKILDRALMLKNEANETKIKHNIEWKIISTVKSKEKEVLNIFELLD